MPPSISPPSSPSPSSPPTTATPAAAIATSLSPRHPPHQYHHNHHLVSLLPSTSSQPPLLHHDRRHPSPPHHPHPVTTTTSRHQAPTVRLIFGHHETRVRFDFYKHDTGTTQGALGVGFDCHNHGLRKVKRERLVVQKYNKDAFGLSKINTKGVFGWFNRTKGVFGLV
nr:hypothetical protein [Tanacetum cinerariifolium]GEZ33390.1 hypothetical protein [Tanacetum cinerariifolium]